jgi:hypothetical protein
MNIVEKKRKERRKTWENAFVKITRKCFICFTLLRFSNLDLELVERDVMRALFYDYFFVFLFLFILKLYIVLFKPSIKNPLPYITILFHILQNQL